MESFENSPPNFTDEEVIENLANKRAKKALILSIISLAGYFLSPVVMVTLFFVVLYLGAGNSPLFDAAGIMTLIIYVAFPLASLICGAFGLVISIRARKNPFLTRKGAATTAIVLSSVSLFLIVSCGFSFFLRLLSVF